MKYLLKFYLATVALLIGAKVVFMLCNASGHGVTMGDYFSVVAHGLSLDLSTALYFLIVPLLVTLLYLRVNVPRWVLKVYNAVIAFAFALAFVADTSLYPFWGFKLDASCLQYLEQPEGITASVSVGYLIVRALLLILITFLIYKILPLPSSKEKWEKVPLGSLSFWKRLGVGILSLPLIVIGIRGGLGESTTNIGQVYYSQNQFLNHAAVNPVFSFLYSLAHQLGDLSQYDFMDDELCEQLLTGVYTTESCDTDTLLNTPHPDIVVILMESAGEQFAQAMPRLQQLKQEGINFTHCYANSWRTDRGTVCTLSGYPSFPSLSVMKMPEKSRTLPSIARTLQAQGYETTYLYGGDINFTNMRSYLISTGWQTLISMDDFTRAEQNSAQWGVRDDITFSRLTTLIHHPLSNTHHPTPNTHHPTPNTHHPTPNTHHPTPITHLIGYSTLSSHEPWDVPAPPPSEGAGGGPTPQGATEEELVLNAFAYLDNCIGDFVDNLRHTPAWDNLLIILTADHGINHDTIDQSKPLQKNHIPMLWIGGAVKEPRTVDIICNQSDLAATLLGQLGLPHSDFTFSRDVLSSSYTYPTAVHNYYNAQWITDSTGHVLYDFDARQFIVKASSDDDRLLQVSKAILQRTTHDLQNR